MRPAQAARSGPHQFDRPYTYVPAIGFAIAFLTDPFGTYIELTEGMDNPKPGTSDQ